MQQNQFKDAMIDSIGKIKVILLSKLKDPKIKPTDLDRENIGLTIEMVDKCIKLAKAGKAVEAGKVAEKLIKRFTDNKYV